MKKLIITLTCVSFITLLFYSCASVESVASKITIESEQIPRDMKTEDFILIGVLKGKNSYDKYIKEEFSKYTGKYILATDEEIKSKYADVSKYRYIMDFTDETSTRYTQTSGTTTSHGYRYYILDRKDDRKYNRKSKSSSFAMEMRAYLLAIESIRKK